VENHLENKESMTKDQKRTFSILGLIGLFYFCLFIVPNLTGAKDAVMLSVFQQDEFAEYPFVLRMLTSDLSFYQTLRYFIIYLFYYYGYPFFFFSALAILPIKWILGPDWVLQTQWIVLVLRQCVNVLPAILAAGFLVFMQTRFRSTWKSVILFLVLLIFPPLVFNNLWWHPDGLLLLFATLTLFFLTKDNFRFGRNFFLAAFFTGLTVSTKLLGVFFFLSVAVYLVWGLWQRKLTFKKAILMGLAYIGVMFVTILLSNPVLLLPIERGEVFAAYRSGFTQLSLGFYERSSGWIKWIDFLPLFWKSYGQWYFLVFIFGLSLISVIKNKNRLFTVLYLCWFVANTVYLTFFTSVMKNYYMLASILPLLSSLNLLLDAPEELKNSGVSVTRRKKTLVQMIVVLGLFLFAWQAYLYIRHDLAMGIAQIQREKNSSNIQFFNSLDEKVFLKIPATISLRIYRDWRAYVEPRPNWTIEYDWNFAHYDYIRDLNPDVIILEYENVHYFASPTLLENALDREKAEKRFAFYRDAELEDIEGYTLAFKDGFGYAFLRDDFYKMHFLE
jgi:hypothetical protein